MHYVHLYCCRRIMIDSTTWKLEYPCCRDTYKPCWNGQNVYKKSKITHRKNFENFFLKAYNEFQGTSIWRVVIRTFLMEWTKIIPERKTDTMKGTSFKCWGLQRQLLESGFLVFEKWTCCQGHISIENKKQVTSWL